MPLDHRGYGAYISHNGEEVELYKPKLEKDKVTMSAYIVSESGMEFNVHWIESKPPSHLSVEIRMDGRRMGVVSHVKGSSQTSNRGFRVAVDALAPYHFAPLVTHDDDELPSAYSEDLGTIEIRLRRSTSAKQEVGAQAAIACRHESLGDKKNVKAKSTILKPILIDDKPYAVFRFYYRPRDFLESKGIIRGRSPSRSTSATVVGSAQSSSGHRKKRQRPPSEAPPSPRPDSPIPPKRRRFVLEQDEDMSTPTVEEDGSRPMPMPGEDENDDKENVVEIHLSSRDNYTIPGESASCVRVKAEPDVGVERNSSPRIKRESSSEPPRRPSKRIKRGPSPFPARKTSPPVKREPSPLPSLLPPPPARRMPSPAPVIKTEPVSPQRLLAPAVKTERLSPNVKRESSDADALGNTPPLSSEGVVQEELLEPKEEETWDEEEETLVEIHVSSRNQHLVFGRPPATAKSDGAKKVKREPGV
uniref:Rab/GTPase n=1 Tax=Ganoderma boninense TaxID=34458 RepID=A0A5K1K0G0_9APHY|nr:Putative Rab/GTPase [Ganoderma boninense]